MPAIGRSTFAGNNTRSQLKIKKKGNKTYEYYFTDMEFITDQQSIVIFFDLPEIELERGQSRPNFVSIVNYCATRPTAVESVDPNSPGTPRNTPYPRGNRDAAFKVTLDQHEMVFLGVIVELEEGGHPVHIICDPQVGNGPPSGDASATISKYRPAVLIGA